MSFTVAILDQCKWCNKMIDKSLNKRLRSYCSTPCRNKWLDKDRYSKGGKERQIAKTNLLALNPDKNKKKCGICGLWFKKPASHVYLIHGLSALEYKQSMGLPVSKGILGAKSRERASQMTKEWNMGEQLKVSGLKTRYTIGDPKAKKTSPFAGRKFEHNDYY